MKLNRSGLLWRVETKARPASLPLDEQFVWLQTRNPLISHSTRPQVTGSHAQPRSAMRSAISTIIFELLNRESSKIEPRHTV